MNEQKQGGPILHIDALDEKARKILKALGSKPRLQMLELLQDQVLNISEIAEALDMPLSTANLHIKNLEQAGLLLTELMSGERGLQKACSRVYDAIVIQLPRGQKAAEEVVELSMPIGAFASCDITPTCGLASEKRIIGLFDDPKSFYEPERMNAQLLWFHHGYVEYRFPNRLPSNIEVKNLQLSFELCSEAPLHHKNWPSDISVWINDVEVGTWTSPGDFGGQRGILTPEWWDTWNTQYGLLKMWQVNKTGSFIDGLKISEITPNDLGIMERQFISVRIGVKPDAKNVGGINIFGRMFGNYPQDIHLRLQY